MKCVKCGKLLFDSDTLCPALRCARAKPARLAALDNLVGRGYRDAAHFADEIKVLTDDFHGV
jgi:hypothetical protein